MRETKHDYQNCLTGNHYCSEVNGMFDSWKEFKETHVSFGEKEPPFNNYDYTYHFIFRYDVNKQDNGMYSLELCMMFQRKGIYSNIHIGNITEEDLDTEVEIWLKGRLRYLKSLWIEIDD